jgi:hypothetical protein
VKAQTAGERSAISVLPLSSVLVIFSVQRSAPFLPHLYFSSLLSAVDTSSKRVPERFVRAQPCRPPYTGSHQDFRKELTQGVIYIFRTPGVGSSDASRPLKARRPGKNLGTFLWLGFFCLLRPRGVRVPVPWRLVRTPRVSRHVAAARKSTI